MEETVRKSPAPFYAVAVVWLVYALLFPLYKPLHYVLLGAASVVVFLVVNRLCRSGPIGQEKKAEETKKAEAPKEDSTGDPALDKMLKDGRLAAKNLFTKIELRDVQTAFARDVGAKYGLQRGVEGSNRAHLTELQFKIQTSEKALKRASERVSEAAREEGVLRQMASDAEKRLSKTRAEAAGVNTEYLAKRAYVDACGAASDVSVMYPAYAVVKKNLLGKETVTVPKEMWEKRWVSANERSILQKATDRFEGAVEDYRQSRAVSHVDALETKLGELSQENRNLRRQVSNLKNQVGHLQHEMQQQEDSMLAKFQQAIDFLPEETYARIADNYNALDEAEQAHEIDFGPEL